MRIAFVRCNEAEVEAATARLGHDFRIVDVRRVSAAEFDVAIIGSAAIIDGHLPSEVEARVDAPVIVMLRDRSEYARCLAPFPIVAIEDADRLPVVVKRLLNLRSLIAAKTAAEERLAAREAQLSFAQELARLGSWEWDAGTNRILLSPEMIRTFGLQRDFSSLDEWLTLIEPQDVKAVEHAFAEALESGEPVETRFRARRLDGTLFFVHVRMKRVGGTDGQPLRVVGVSQDITGTMQAEQTLRESEARYRTLVEQAKDIIVAFDAEGRVQSLNQAFEELTGWSRVEWIGEHFLDALEPESRDAAAEHIRAIFSGEAIPPQPEYRLRTKHGGSLTVEGVGRRVESDGRVVGVVVVVRNVTARKEADARAEKEQRLASLGQLATSVAHEFNNVLMSIMPFAELLQRRFPDDERVATATHHIIRATRRGREISQEILRFARPVDPVIEPVVVSDWIEEFRRKVSAMFGPLYSIAVDLPQREVACFADRALLDQVATNIALNARDAMPSGGSFRISAQADASSVEISFADGGAGIAAELLNRIFDPLYTTKRGGNGLGLTIAHQAMLQQEGTISVRSRVGEGSTFSLILRRAEMPAARAVDAPVTAGRRVLIVEDDESVGEGIRALLSDEGFDVHLVERGGEAYRAVETFDPKVVLLDVNLPDVSGVDVFDQLRTRWPALPVIFSTGHADAAALSDVSDRRAPSITKPYDISELMSLMATLSAG